MKTVSAYRTGGQSETAGRSFKALRLRNLTRCESVLMLAIAVGVLARLALIACSRGSNDMLTWTYFADLIERVGLWETYRIEQLFNHPPLMGLMAQLLRNLSELTGLPFRVSFKLPMLAADLLCMAVLWRCWSTPALHAGRKLQWPQSALLAVAIFSCNPISVLVTGFHGNTDSLCAVLGLVAALLHSKKMWLWAGLALGASVNVKIVGLMWAPALFFMCPRPSAAARFVGGFGVAMLPFLGPLMQCPDAFYRNAIAYNSNVELWGVHVVSIKLWDTLPVLAQPAYAYREWGRYAVIGSILLAAVWSRYRHHNVLQSATISMGLFLVLTPGFGVQYLVWVVPLLAGVSLLRSAFWGLSGGAFIGWVYVTYLTEEFPLRSDHHAFIEDPIWVVGVVAWFVLLGTLVRLLSATPARNSDRIDSSVQTQTTSSTSAPFA